MSNCDKKAEVFSAVENNYIRGDIFYPATSWLPPSTAEVCFIIGLTGLTDYSLANKLGVNDRTVRKWKSGETTMVFTTWCCLCCVLDVYIIYR